MNLINVSFSKFVSQKSSSANFKIIAAVLIERVDRSTF